MTAFEIQPLGFERHEVTQWAVRDPRHKNWPVVYTINNATEIYVGETTSAEMRLAQHLVSPNKNHLTQVNVILDSTFNKSACLDLESHLIKFFHADEKYTVLNGNAGLTDSDYFERDKYRQQFDEVFKQLVDLGYLTRSVPELINTDFFKYSPFKSLNTEQAGVVGAVLEKVFENTAASPIVIQGDPGTGKTIVAVYLIKLLRDIARLDLSEVAETDSVFSEFFQPEYQLAASDLSIGLLIPQKSLRETLRRVFKRTPGLNPEMVLDPFQVGESEKLFDVLVVDEAHRLQQRANQSAATQNIRFREINEQLFGTDDIHKTQLDWVKAKSKTQIFLLDTAQKVRPADLPDDAVSALMSGAASSQLLFPLLSQMRVAGGEDYIEFVGGVLAGKRQVPRKKFGTYDLRIFDSFSDMKHEIAKRDEEVGLSRIIAGYAWKWVTKSDVGASFDFKLDGVELTWNRRDTDWVNSATSSEEVGSIHTIQGYDLNYAGVIIGPDLRYDSAKAMLYFDRDNYFDVKGRENNRVLGITYSDEDMLRFVTNIYRVLLTRGIKGTYIYVVDEALRGFLKESA